MNRRMIPVFLIITAMALLFAAGMIAEEMTDAIGQWKYWHVDYAITERDTTENDIAPTTGDAETFFIGDYSYTVAGGLATITGYTGGDGEMVIPDHLDGCPVSAIGKSAFNGNESLTGVVIPDSVVTIGEYAFFECENLENANIPSGLTSIGEYAFDGCALARVVIPGSLTTIGDSAFSSNPLTELNIHEGVNKIEDYAFANCRQLKSVVLPNGVTSIGDEVFGGCDELTIVIIPASVAQIGEGAFEKSDDLVLTVSAGSYAEQYAKDNGIEYSIAE